MPFFHNRLVNSNVNLNNKNLEVQRYLDSINYINYRTNKVLEYIKEHEGYMTKPYKCLAGVYTIGYGHVILPEDNFKYPISKEQADSILKVDFNKALDIVNKHIDTLPYNKQLALAHFTFCLGEGAFIKMYMKRVIKENKPIAKEIVKWIFIKTNSGTIRSNYLLRMRKYELKFYNNAR